MEELIILTAHTYMKLFGMPSGTCAHCGLAGIPVTVYTAFGGTRKIVFEDGQECQSLTDEWMLITPADGTWHMERRVKDERINIFERGVQLPTDGQWADIPGSQLQVMTRGTDQVGLLWVRANPAVRVGPLMIPDDIEDRD